MTLTKAHLIQHLRDHMGITRRDAEMLVEQFFNELSDNLCRGENIKLSGFGQFYLHDAPERVGRNPATKEPKTIPPRRVVKFRASRKLKQILKQPKDGKNQ
jgi:integration host factor subunit alpha